MKKVIISAAIAIAALVSCQKEIATDEVAVKPGYVELTLTAQSDADTKSSLQNGKEVIWEVGEKVAVFTSASEAPEEFTVMSVEGTNVKIWGSVPEGATSFVAAYPFESAVSWDKSAVVKMNVGNQAVTASQNVDPKALASVAYFADASATPTFKNTLALLKFTVGVDGVKKVRISTESAGALAGEVSVTVSPDDAPVAAGAKTAAIEVACEEGFTKDAAYYAAVAPGAYTGFSVRTYVDANVKLLYTAAAGEIKRNDVLVLGDIATGAKVMDMVFEITNAEDLALFQKNADKYKADEVVKIANDIDLAGATLEKALVFDGILDGQGFKLKNWTADGHQSLIQNLGGKITNLVLDESCDFSVSDVYSCYVCDTVLFSGSLEKIVNKATVAKRTEALTGLHFGYLCRISYGHISDCANYGGLEIEAPSASGNLWIGGLTAFYNSRTKKALAAGVPEDGIVNCENHGNIDITIPGATKHIYLGGIAGGTTNTNYNAKDYRGNVVGCTNTGSISYVIGTNGDGTYANIGGVAGIIYGCIKDCSNSGAITYTTDSGDTGTTRPAVGGVAGAVVLSGDNCTNSGAITVKGTFGAGGDMAKNGTGVHTNPSFGGVFGQIGGNAYADVKDKDTFFVKNCHNSGKLTVDDNMPKTNKTNNFIGGVTGFTAAPVSDCTNEGVVDVKSKSYAAHVAGIVGKLFNTISDCSNTGDITLDVVLTTTDNNRSSSNSFVGGVVGDQNQAIASIKNLTNSGKITFKNCNNTTLRYAAGVVARFNAVIDEISGLTNSGDVVAVGTQAVRIGGISGLITAKAVKDCHNTGNISANLAHNNGGAGGVAGFITQNGIKVSDCTSEGDVTCTGSLGFAGLFAGGIGNTNQTWDAGIVGGKVTADTGINAGFILGGTVSINDGGPWTTNVGSTTPFQVKAGSSVNGTDIADVTLPDKLSGFTDARYTINWNVDIQTPKPALERVWGLYNTGSDANWFSGIQAGGAGMAATTDRNIAMDDDYIYLSKSSSYPQIFAIDRTDPAKVKTLPIDGIAGGTPAISCVRVIKNTDASVNGGKDILLVSNLKGEYELKVYAYLNGIEANPTQVLIWQWDNHANASCWRRYGDKFTVTGTWQAGALWFQSQSDGKAIYFPVASGAVDKPNEVSHVIDATANTIKDIAVYPGQESEVFVTSWSKAAFWSNSGTKNGNNWVVWTEGAAMDGLKNTYGYNFFTFGSKKYIAYTKIEDSYHARLQVMEDTGTFAGSLTARQGLMEMPLQHASDFTAASPAYGQNNGDCVVRTIGGDVYIAAMGSDLGLSLFKIVLK